MTFRILPCLDSDEMAAARKRELDVDRNDARALGQSAVVAGRTGRYMTLSGDEVEIGALVTAAREARVSIRPDAPLPAGNESSADATTVQAVNETTLQAAYRLVARGRNTLALNFANGIHPGGGFLSGARAQEEVICRSSALFETLVGDAMYEEHKARPRPDSTDWAILSPNVPVFRKDDGSALSQPWLCNFITSAAPVASRVGQPESGDLLQRRIHRVLDIARSYGYETLVLGAWGCGAFGNDPVRTAKDLRDALLTEYDSTFAEVVLAIADWSPDRRFLGPFRDAFAEVV